MMTFLESDEETKKEAKEKFDKWSKEQEKAKAKAEKVVEEAKEVVEKADDALLQEDTKEEIIQDNN